MLSPTRSRLVFRILLQNAQTRPPASLTTHSHSRSFTSSPSTNSPKRLQNLYRDPTDPKLDKSTYKFSGAPGENSWRKLEKRVLRNELRDRLRKGSVTRAGAGSNDERSWTAGEGVDLPVVPSGFDREPRKWLTSLKTSSASKKHAGRRVAFVPPPDLVLPGLPGWTRESRSHDDSARGPKEYRSAQGSQRGGFRVPLGSSFGLRSTEPHPTSPPAPPPSPDRQSSSTSSPSTATTTPTTKLGLDPLTITPLSGLPPPIRKIQPTLVFAQERTRARVESKHRFLKRLNAERERLLAESEVENGSKSSDRDISAGLDEGSRPRPTELTPILTPSPTANSTINEETPSARRARIALKIQRDELVEARVMRMARDGEFGDPGTADRKYKLVNRGTDFRVGRAAEGSGPKDKFGVVTPRRSDGSLGSEESTRSPSSSEAPARPSSSVKPVRTASSRPLLGAGRAIGGQMTSLTGLVPATQGNREDRRAYGTSNGRGFTAVAREAGRGGVGQGTTASEERPRATQRWDPKKRLSVPAMAGLRALNAQDPQTYSVPVLSERFGVSYEAVKRVLRSKFRDNVGRRTIIPGERDTSIEGSKWDVSSWTSPAVSPVKAIEKAFRKE